MKTLSHSGIILPAYEANGLWIVVRGKKFQMTPLQEEMAISFIKKSHLDCMKDEVFIRNFLADFSRALAPIARKMGLELNDGELSLSDVDFGDVKTLVEKQKKQKESMSAEEKKADLANRKAEKEANRERYGFAVVDGERVELAAYRAEPAGIFMGRGEHPLRGRWKPAVRVEDITLNLSPKAPTPAGFEKAKRVWAPDGFWIAKWDDNRKYVWIAENEPVRQQKDVEKYDMANYLASHIADVKIHIFQNLTSKDPQRRKVATCCYLIQTLGLRVGDEKDEDEADTVGATTLRTEHISIDSQNDIAFNFLGKDCVPFKKTLKMPGEVVDNLKELGVGNRILKDKLLFEGVNSIKVNAFLKEAMDGLSAKVFRTYMATRTVRDFLNASRVTKEDPPYEKKFIAKMANLEAAKAMNHRRKVPKTWESSFEKKKERLEKATSKTAKNKTAKRTAAAEKLAEDMILAENSMEYNLNTSLKSYIDPRVYAEWARRVNLDPLQIYPKTLQRKFSWALQQLIGSAASVDGNS